MTANQVVTLARETLPRRGPAGGPRKLYIYRRSAGNYEVHAYPWRSVRLPLVAVLTEPITAEQLERIAAHPNERGVTNYG